MSCYSHKLNLELHRMIGKDIRLKETIESIHDMMRSCKQKLKNRDVSRNLICLNPVLNVDTRWSSSFHMISRFNDIREDLIQVADDEHADLIVDSRPSLKSKSERFSKMLKEIKEYLCRTVEVHWTV